MWVNNLPKVVTWCTHFRSMLRLEPTTYGSQGRRSTDVATTPHRSRRRPITYQYLIICNVTAPAVIVEPYYWIIFLLCYFKQRLIDSCNFFLNKRTPWVWVGSHAGNELRQWRRQLGYSVEQHSTAKWLEVKKAAKARFANRPAERDRLAAELDLYMDEPNVLENSNPLNWWRANCSK